MPMTVFMRSLFIAFALLFATATPSFAAEPAVYTSWNNNLAIGGYDTVSFFSGKPVEGKSEFTYTYKGAQWQFSTQGNLELFKTNPTAFAPQYGGYCAWAVAQGKLAKGSPKHWKVEDGKLYVNFNGRIQRRWEKDIPGFIATANTQWPSILED